MAAADFELVENLPFERTTVIGARARIGLVVLASDYTIEHEFRTLIDQPGVDVFHARIMNSPEISPQSLAAMEPAITETATRILPDDHVDVLAYACTSASVVLGSDNVSTHPNKAKPDAKTTDPVRAAFAALQTLGARRIALLTPYQSSVNRMVHGCFNDAGFDVPIFGSFNEPMDPVVAQISDESIANAVRRLTRDHDVDAVFVSCTTVRMAGLIPALEDDIGVPVTSSNHALAWHCLRLAGIEQPVYGRGRLYELAPGSEN